MRERTFRLSSGVLALCLCFCFTAKASFRAGAAKVDVTPQQYPVIQNGGFLEALLERTAGSIARKGDRSRR